MLGAGGAGAGAGVGMTLAIEDEDCCWCSGGRDCDGGCALSCDDPSPEDMSTSMKPALPTAESRRLKKRSESKK